MTQPVVATGPIGADAGESTHSQQQAQNLANFLQYARQRTVMQTGTIPSGSTGGSAQSAVAYARDIPTVPVWATDVYIEAQLPLTVTTPASSTTGISAYFPWSILQSQLLLAGAPPWDMMSLVPWWVDEITSDRFYDPSNIGPGLAAQEDPGPFATTNGGFTPGGTIVSTGSPTTTTGTVQFSCHMSLQRRRHLMFGCVPLGDPENRPRLNIQLSGLVGPNPEQNPFQTLAGTATTASLSALANITVIYVCKSIDLLPDGVSVIPTPIVGMGLAINYTTKSIQNAGQVFPIAHQASMVYEKIVHCVFNAGAAVRPDYFGLWLTGEQASARWEFDAQQAGYNVLYDLMQRQYKRFLPVGCLVADFESGEIPELPQETPFNGLMTPDTGYAQEFGIPATPAMNTAVRIPTGTTMSGAYVAEYEFGLVNVPY